MGAVSLGVAVACGSESSSSPSSSFDAGSSSSGTSGNLGGPSDSGNPPAAPATDVDAVITTDNAFSFGYGNEQSITTFIRGEGSGGAAIFDCPVGFGPTAYVVPAASAPTGAYLYIIAWADEYYTQGTLAQFKRVGGAPVYSGDGSWQVCATGTPFDYLGTGPDQDTVNARIGECNQGSSNVYSKGWVNTAGPITPGAIGKLAYGEANDDAGGEFPIVCQVDDAGVKGIDPNAKWMWFDPEDGTTPFHGNTGNRTKTFLVFRLPADALPSSVK